MIFRGLATVAANISQINSSQQRLHAQEAHGCGHLQQFRDVAVGLGLVMLYCLLYYRGLGFQPGQFPDAETYAAQALSIPLYPGLTDAQQDRVVAALTAALQA